MWKEVLQIFSWGGFPTEGITSLLERGIFFIYEEGNKLTIYSTNSLKPIDIDVSKGKLSKIGEKEVYISFGNILKKLDLNSLSLNETCISNKEHIGQYGDNYYSAVTITRNPKKYKKELGSIIPCKKLFEWNDRRVLILIYRTSKIILSDGNSFVFYDFIAGIKLWEFTFNDSDPSQRYIQLVDDVLVIVLSFLDEFNSPSYNHIIGLDINSGEVKWRLEDKTIFSWYQFDCESKKLFTVGGFNNVVYQVIDPLTGTIEIEKNLSESHKNIEVNCHNVFFAEDNYLYFSSNTRAPIGDSEFDYDYLQPQVGAINIQTQKLEYLVDIPIDMKNISRPSNALNSAPIVHRNRMYIMDNENYLHILEK